MNERTHECMNERLSESKTRAHHERTRSGALQPFNKDMQAKSVKHL